MSATGTTCVGRFIQHDIYLLNTYSVESHTCLTVALLEKLLLKSLSGTVNQLYILRHGTS